MTFIVILGAFVLLAWGIAAIAQAILSWWQLRQFKRSQR